MPHDPLTTPFGAAKILVVDDSRLSAKKLAMAMRALGHRAETAASGAEALSLMQAEAFDLLLLDIVMPGMDGFEVLDAVRADPALRDVPVIVVSSLEDETDSVVRAIRLGADDFLPKDFEPEILQARLEASLARKRARGLELEYIRQVQSLTRAAERIEEGRFSPETLGIDDLTSRGDAVGRLATVFRGMAAEIYLRELRLRRAVALLEGSFLVIAVGVVWGLTPALARMASGIGSNPLGLAVWVNGIAAVCCLAVASLRGRLPRLTLQELWFYVQWALVAGVLQRLTIFWVSEHVEATVLSLIVVLEGLMTFILAAAVGLEQPTRRRLLGMLVSIAGVAMLILGDAEASGAGVNLWTLAALLVPFLFAVQGLLIAKRRPMHVDIFASGGIMMLLSTLFLLPLAWSSGQFLALSTTPGRLEFVVLLMGLGAATSLLLIFHLTAKTGAVFASLNAYSCSLAGIFWGILLLGEEMTLLAWCATGAVMLGLWLVEPKPSDEELVLDRSLGLDERADADAERPVTGSGFAGSAPGTTGAAPIPPAAPGATT